MKTNSYAIFFIFLIIVIFILFFGFKRKKNIESFTSPTWHVSPRYGMTCAETCRNYGGFNANATKHFGNPRGKVVFPNKRDGDLIDTRGWVSIECSSNDNDTNWGSNDGYPDANFRYPACRVHCVCNDSKPNTTTPKPVNCEVSGWGGWSACNKSCGGGVHTRNRTVVRGADHGGSACPPLSQTKSCNTQPCPVNCEVSGWGGWSACNKSCGGGVHTRNRTVVRGAANGGIACPPLSQTKSCNTQPCPVNCDVSGWGGWSACNKSCGGGVHTRNRTVVKGAAHGGSACPPLSQIKSCNTQPCPVNCEVSGWGGWSACNKSCGGGVHTRNRTVVKGVAHGGIACPPLSQTKSCNTQPCPVNCDVSGWGGWSACNKLCGGGVHTRNRTVVKGTAHGGSACPPLSQTKSCNTQPCPVNCDVSGWGGWSACNKLCGGGVHTRNRTVVKGAAHGGSACPPLSQTKSCNTQPCPTTTTTTTTNMPTTLMPTTMMPTTMMPTTLMPTTMMPTTMMPTTMMPTTMMPTTMAPKIKIQIQTNESWFEDNQWYSNRGGIFWRKFFPKIADFLNNYSVGTNVDVNIIAGSYKYNYIVKKINDSNNFTIQNSAGKTHTINNWYKGPLTGKNHESTLNVLSTATMMPMMTTNMPIRSSQIGSVYPQFISSISKNNCKRNNRRNDKKCITDTEKCLFGKINSLDCIPGRDVSSCTDESVNEKLLECGVSMQDINNAVPTTFAPCSTCPPCENGGVLSEDQTMPSPTTYPFNSTFQTSAPVDMTSAPVNMTSAPVNMTSGPVDMTSGPMGTTSVSVDMTSAPVNMTSAPVYMTSAPVDMTSGPVDMTSGPMGTTSAPVDMTSGPMGTTSAPVNMSSVPIQSTQISNLTPYTNNMGTSDKNIVNSKTELLDIIKDEYNRLDRVNRDSQKYKPTVSYDDNVNKSPINIKVSYNNNIDENGSSVKNLHDFNLDNGLN